METIYKNLKAAADKAEELYNAGELTFDEYEALELTCADFALMHEDAIFGVTSITLEELN